MLGLALVGAAISACGGSAPPKTLAATAPSALWSARPSLTGIDAATIWGFGADLFAAGRGASIAHSGDDGLTFSYAPSGLPGEPQLRRLAGTSATDVWLVGSDGAGAPALLHSADRGASWQSRTFGDAVDLESVWALDARRIVLGGTGHISCTEDGGATWRRVLADEGTRVLALWGTDLGDVLYAAGARSGTADGAAVATPTTSAAPPSVDDGCDGGAAPMGTRGDEHGLLLRSTDGGLTWTSLGVQTAGPLSSVWGTPDGRVVVASGPRASLAWTYDDGAHWFEQSRALAPPQDDLSAVWVGPGDASFFFATPSGLVRDVAYDCAGPLRLTYESLPPSPDGALGVAAIWGPSSGDVWAVGPGGLLRHRP
jgi:photosystem II stability/assembly factor-like uncharacterized protein